MNVRARAGHARFIALAVITILLAGLGMLLAPPATAAGSLTPSTTSGIAGESIRFTGSVPTKVVRPVQLQRRSGSRWVSVAAAKTSRTGHFHFTTMVRASATTYRVSAPAVRIRGKRYGATTTPSRTVTTLGQAGQMTLPENTSVGAPTTATGLFTPVRAGRPVVLEQLVEGSWVEVAERAQSATGQVSIGVPTSVGEHQFRMVARPYAGAAAVVTPTDTITIVPGASRVSVSEGFEGSSTSHEPSVSGDGRFVVFASYADNLVLDDSNNSPDIFLWERGVASLIRVSVAPGGAEATGGSSVPQISADGRWVVFRSEAPNLVPGDTNNISDIFVWDREHGTTRRVNVSSSGTQADSSSYQPAISANGRFVAFQSDATNLVPGDFNEVSDIFVRDRREGTTTRVSVAPDGGQSTGGHSLDPTISADGRFVAFHSSANNLVPTDTNGAQDVFVHDRADGSTTRASLGPGGAQVTSGAYSHATISADGSVVAFESNSSQLVADDTNSEPDVFVHDLAAGTTTRVSVSSAGNEGDLSSFMPAPTADGRYVLFASNATGLVAGDTNNHTDVFRHDRVTGTTIRVSLSPEGHQLDGRTVAPSVSADGRSLAVESSASNLLPEGPEGEYDVFLLDLGTPR